jgi:hypothetical protein
MDVHLTLDPQALDALGKSKPRWDTEVTMRIAQIGALLVAGGWAYFTYVTFQKESNRLSLAASEARLTESQLSLKKTDLDIKKGTIEVSRLSQAPVTTTERLNIQPVAGSKGYLVSYDYTFTNSGTGKVMIDALIAEAFVAHTPVNDGDTVINDVGDGGPLQWELRSQKGFVADPHWKPTVKVVSGPTEIDGENGGGGTGVMNAGESLDGNITLLVHGQPTDFVGFRVRYSIYRITAEGKEILASNDERLRNFLPLGVVTEKKGNT